MHCPLPHLAIMPAKVHIIHTFYKFSNHMVYIKNISFSDVFPKTVKRLLHSDTLSQIFISLPHVSLTNFTQQKEMPPSQSHCLSGNSFKKKRRNEEGGGKGKMKKRRSWRGKRRTRREK